MPSTELTTFRLDKGLLNRLDEYAKHLEEQTPGLKITRSDALRVLLIKAIGDTRAFPTNGVASSPARMKPNGRQHSRHPQTEAVVQVGGRAA